MSQLLGQKILNNARDKVGDVNDVILDRAGKVSKVVVGVGGFLGIGEKNVALDFDKLAISQGSGNQLSVMVAETKEALLAAPEWVDPNAARPTMTK
jgi:sporulation protein YlmC with PRC-barrel domain